MATVKKKVKKAQDGLCDWSDKRGGGVSSGRSGNFKTEGYKSVRTPRMTRREQEESDKQEAQRLIRVGAKRLTPILTAPGVRPGEEPNKYKKGSQSFFGGDSNVNDAKYGKKVAKKSATKKAKVGTKLKSKKK